MKNDSIARHNNQKCKLQEIILPEWVYNEKSRKPRVFGLFLFVKICSELLKNVP